MSKAPKVIRTNPELWERCKKEAVEKLGKFSARAMQQAVILYKKNGGGYLGAKQPGTSVNDWDKKKSKP